MRTPLVLAANAPEHCGPRPRINPKPPWLPACTPPIQKAGKAGPVAALSCRNPSNISFHACACTSEEAVSRPFRSKRTASKRSRGRSVSIVIAGRFSGRRTPFPVCPFLILLLFYCFLYLLFFILEGRHDFIEVIFIESIFGGLEKLFFLLFDVVLDNFFENL
jgi:hypothetical protein